MQDLVLLCGRYEGIDERVTHVVSDRVSIGPYVLSGGEVAAMATLDAVTRKLPGAVSNPASVVSESHSEELEGGAEYPHYTRPAEFRGWAVPEVLLSGHHGEIETLARAAGGKEVDYRLASARLVAALRARESPATLAAGLRSERGSVDIIDNIERQQLREGLPQFKAGDTVKVHFKVVEGTRHRIQVFQGTVIKRQGQGVRETFTVRKQSFGVGVERTFPVHSPKIDKIEVTAIGDVRRAKLYYLRQKVGKQARVREKQR